MIQLTVSFILLLLGLTGFHLWLHHKGPTWKKLLGLAWLWALSTWLLTAYLWSGKWSHAQNWVGFVWTMLTTIVLLQFINILVFEHLRAGTRIPRLLRDLLFGFITIIILLSALQSFFNLKLTTLLTTSAVLTIILGLALQETLSNLFSGLSLNLEQAFNLGDWLKIGDYIGKVVQINWRSVHMQTRLGEIIVMPNSQIAKETLINYSVGKSQPLWHQIKIGLSYDDSPHRVEKVIRETIREVVGPDLPEAVVRLEDFQDFSILYDVRYPYRDFQSVEFFNAEIRRRLWYALRREGLEIPFPIRTVIIHKRETHRQKIKNRAILLKKHSLLSEMSIKRLKWLSSKVSIKEYAKGETVFREGDPADGLFLILEGSVNIIKTKKKRTQILATLSSNDVVGEMAVLSHEPRTATVVPCSNTKLAFIPIDTIFLLLEREESFREKLYKVFETHKALMGEFDSQTLRDTTAGTPVEKYKGLPKFFHNIRRLFGTEES